MRTLLLTIAIAAAVAAFALTLHLIRSRSRDRGPWNLADLLTALGIALGLLTATLSALASQPHNEPPEVVAYRQSVRAACTGLNAVHDSNPIAAALASGMPTMDRDALERGFQAQLDSAAAILTALWAQPVPARLAADRQTAKDATDLEFALETAKLDRLREELPKRFTFEQLASYASTFAEITGAAAAANAGLSRLASDTCRTTTSS